jgi:hypothetical protein
MFSYFSLFFSDSFKLKRRENMASLWDDIAKTIREGVDTVVSKTEEYTKIGKIKIDIINIKRSVEKNFTELGGRVYHLMVEQNKTQISGDKEVKKIIDSIKLLEKELQEKKAELEKVGKKAPSEKPAPAAAKTTAKPKSTAATPKSRTAKNA